MVFPIGAHVWELAADHLDRLPGKSLLERLVQKRGVTQDGHATGTKQPHDGAEGRRYKADGDSNDTETGVELRGRKVGLADFEVLPVQFADKVHADGNENDVEEEPRVGEQGVDA